MEAYERSTAPLINFYAELRLLVTIPATGTPDEICARTITALEKRDIRS
jgi:adenylate kinase family enzyme